MISYCLPLQETWCDAVRNNITRNKHVYQRFEVWLDLLADFSIDFLDELIAEWGESLIVLFRRPLLAPVYMPWSLRTQVMTHLHLSKVWLDLDVSTQERELQFLQEQNLSISLIASYHNYEQTPTLPELEHWIKRMTSYQPSIYKLATYCHSPQDAVRLLSLGLQLRSQGLRCVVLGMGEHGAVTRIFGTLWFNDMIFAPPDLAGSSAPGQLSRSQLEVIFQAMRSV